MRRHPSGRRGQALVEFALVLPLLALLLLGIITFGLYLNANVTVEQAARIGARAAAIGDPLGCPGDSAKAGQQTIYGYVDDQINLGLGLSAPKSPAKTLLTPPPTLSVDPADTAQDDVTVTVAYPYQPLIVIPGVMPATVTLTQTYTMMVQNQPPPGAVTGPVNNTWTYQTACP
ncbi:MAG: pilus assembly protein [Actinomycetia bacterium]|nr:pilus assembly protein [Actinomycetes bacterium]